MNGENNIPAVIQSEAVKPERTLDMVAAEIRAFTAGMLNNAIEIGRRMVEAKAMLPYGQFGAWISKNTGYSASAANNFMRLFDEYGAMQGSLFGASAESQTFGKLPPSKALALLAVPAEERETFAVENDAERASVRELKRKIEQYQRERDEALRKAESARAELETAEDDLLSSNRANDRLRKELEDAQNAPPDPLLLAAMREEERKDAEEKVAAQLAESEQAAADAKAELERARKALEDANAAAKLAAEEETKLRKELSGLKKATADNGQLIEETVRKATEKAVAETEARLEQANAEKKEADERRKAAEAEVEEMRKRLAAAESEPAPVEDKEISEFRFLFNQAQETANKMRKIMLKYRSNEDGEKTAQQLSRTMETLGDFIKEAAKWEK